MWLVYKIVYADMPYLETEEEAAENIADINERRDVRKKDNKARTFAPPDDANEKLKTIFKNKPSMTEEEFKKFLNDNISKKEINLDDINDLINEIDKYKYRNALVSNNDDDDYKVVSFKNLYDFINDITDGKINNFNNKKKLIKIGLVRSKINSLIQKIVKS